MEQKKPQFDMFVKVDREYGYGHVTARFIQQKDDDYWGYPYQGLQVSCQINLDHGEEKPYAWTVGFEPTYTVVELDEAKRHVKVLSKIQRYLDKVEKDHGRIESYGVYVQRIAACLRPTTIQWANKKGNWQGETMAQLGDTINWLCADIREERKETTVDCGSSIAVG